MLTTSVKGRAWLTLPFTLLVSAMAVCRGDTGDIVVAGVLIAVNVMLFCLIPLELRQKRQSVQLRHTMKQKELGDFTAQRHRLQELLADGKLVRLEEWWEDDELWVDENAHLLFVFEGGEEMDFVLHEPTARELSALLAAQGIRWQASYRAKQERRIIFP